MATKLTDGASLSFSMGGGASDKDWVFNAWELSFDQCYRLGILARDMILEDRRAAQSARALLNDHNRPGIASAEDAGER